MAQKNGWIGMESKIIIKRRDNKNPHYRFVADPVSQPGSPRIGTGETPLLALIDLLNYNKEFNIEVVDKTVKNKKGLICIL